jgi:hypothetical protein
MKRLIVITALILSVLPVWSQTSADLGIQFGPAVYWGDIEEVDYSKSVTPFVGVLGRWNFNPRLAVRGQLVIGSLRAEGKFPNAFIGQSDTRYVLDVPSTQVPPLELYVRDNTEFYYFERNFQSVEALFEFNFRKYQMGNLKKERYTPYLFVGLGGFFSRAPRKGTLILDPSSTSIPGYYEPFYNVDRNKTNDQNAVSLIIPVGFGVKYNISKSLGASFEASVRKTFTDNIDNLDDPKRFQDFDPLISGSYPDSFAADAVTNSDWYATLTFSLYFQVWSSKGNCSIYDKKGPRKYGRK